MGLAGSMALVAWLSRERLLTRIHFLFLQPRGRVQGQTFQQYLANPANQIHLADERLLLIIFASIYLATVVLDLVLNQAQHTPWWFGLLCGLGICALTFGVAASLVSLQVVHRLAWAWLARAVFGRNRGVTMAEHLADTWQAAEDLLFILVRSFALSSLLVILLALP